MQPTNLSKTSLKIKLKHFLIKYYFRKFERIVVEQVQKGFDGRTTAADHDWNYFGAVLYAVTLVSTIGRNKSK